ncbi:MAG: FAD-binding oxidoreductase [Actinomycetota bacterium]|nr:FAD-binding oxidoreductase [Actinomycetota bacterium]
MPEPVASESTMPEPAAPEPAASESTGPGGGELLGGTREPGAGRVLPRRRDLLADVPAEADVVIVGGGLAGCALAYFLAAEGVEVAVLERAELNREASGTNAGSFHFQIAIHQLTGAGTDADRDRLLADVRLLSRAAAMWQDLEGELQADLGVHVTGGLMIAETADQLELLVAKQRIERDGGLETEVLSGPELRSFAPYLADDLAGAGYCPAEGYADPLLAAPAFAARAVEAGAAVRTYAPVERIERLEGAAAARFAVHHARGTLRCHRVVNAAGAWAYELARGNGFDLPLRAEGLHMNVTEPRARLLGPLVQHIGRRLTLKQSSNGTFIIGGGWPARPEVWPARYSVRWSSVAGNAAVARRVVPALAGVRVVHTWAGVWAASNDLLPVVGESARLPGYFTCVVPTGFTLGPLMASRLAGQMAGTAATLPLEFSPDRVTAPARRVPGKVSRPEGVPS